MARKLIVEIVGDSRSYERALNKSATSTQKFGQAMGSTSPKVGKLSSTMAVAGTSGTLLAAAATGLAFKLGGDAVTAASDLNEQISRTEVVMGAAADEMIAWSETTAQSMGISQRAALAAAGTFAGLFQTVGVQRQQAGELSQSLVQLAADLASLQNSSPEEALIALRSGLAGESEPLRRFNIFLTEARVSQEALTASGKKSVQQLTQQEKTTARYNLIMKDSTLAQGNFALTSGELANQQRIARAEMDDLSASAGQVLVPAMQAAVTTMGLFAGSLNDAIDGMVSLKKFLSDTSVFDGWNSAVESATTSTTGFLTGLRDSIPGMERFLELRDRVIGGGVAPVVVPQSVAPGEAEDISRANAEADAAAKTRIDKARVKSGQAIIDQITRQNTVQKSLNTQMAESERRAAHLRDLIREDPANAKLQQRLTAELKKQSGIREQQASIREQQAAAAKQNAADAKAIATAAKAEAAAIAEARREREKAAAAARRQATQRGLFKALGLTAEGDRPTPGSGALLGRAQSMLDSLKGTSLDTKKNRQQLKTIISVLKKNFKTAGKEVRAAILGMLNDISGAADKADKTGPLTKTSGLNTKKILAGMGLSPEEERELRGRLSGINSAGRQLAAPGGGTRTQGARGGFGINDPIFVESHTTINLDGQRVANVVTKQQQKSRRRNPQQKRGPNRHR